MNDRPNPIHPETRAAIDDAVRVGLSGFRRPETPPPGETNPEAATPAHWINRADYDAAMLRLSQIRDTVRCLSDSVSAAAPDPHAVENSLYLVAELIQETEHRLALVR